jgi:hypothetical protein
MLVYFCALGRVTRTLRIIQTYKEQARFSHSLSVAVQILTLFCSTFSATLLAASAVIWEDFLRHLKHFRQEPLAALGDTHERHVQISRAICTCLGLVTVGLAHLAGSFEAVMTISVRAVGVLAGPILAVFVLGFFTTTANKTVRKKYPVQAICTIFTENIYFIESLSKYL